MYFLSNNQVRSLFSVFLACLFLCSACSDSTGPEQEEVAALEQEAEQMEAIGELALQNTSNDVYRFATEIPEEWSMVTNVADDGSVIINMYPESKVAAADLPISIQTAPTIDHIDIYPKGLNSKFPYGENLRLRKYAGTVPAASLWDQNKSRVFLLGNNEVWGYWLYPKNPPADWNDEGFIFAQIAIDNFSSECYDHITGDLKDAQICQPIEGDRLQYYGRVSPESRSYVKHALAGMTFSK